MDLSNKIALVTGAGTGIGKGIAVELAKQGAKVAIHYNSSNKGALDTKEQIDRLGSESIIVQADIQSKNEIERMVEKVIDNFGSIDILVNNAALQLNINLLDYTSSDYDRMMNTNLKGYWQCIQAVVPYMKKKQSGRIINISSVHDKRPTDFDTVYSMTKGAIKMLVRESAIELAKYGITVNMIEPGAVDVGKYKIDEEIDPEISEKKRKERLKKFPLGRVGLPIDIGHIASFIASNESEFMNGAAIRMDGGSMLL